MRIYRPRCEMANATGWLPERNLELEPGLRMDGRDNHCAKPFP